jgi:GT2 family glycosyltransferase
LLHALKISVVILNWNRPQDTIAAAESILRQVYPDFEILIWDNASSDNSRQVLEQRFRHEPRMTMVFGDGNYGVAGGRNRAFPLTAGDIILSLDSDAVLEGTDCFRLLADRFAQDPSIGALSFEVVRPDGHLMWPFSRPAAAWRTREFETIRVDGCAFAVPRKLYDEIGGFAEHFSPYGAEDQHFAYRVIGAGRRVVYFPAVKCVHAFSPKGRTAIQFRRHVRNCLWMPLELFPMPYNVASFAKLAVSLLRDGREQRQVTEFFRGSAEALLGFRPSRRKPISRDAWRRLRTLVNEDKDLALEP